MATIHERQDKNGKTRYTVEIRVKGHPPMSATFQRKTDAKHWAQKREAAIREGEHFGTRESRKKTVSDVIERYLRDVLPNRKSDKENVKRHLEWWKTQVGHYRLYALKPDLIAEYRDKLLSEDAPKAKSDGKKRSPSTVVRYLTSLSVALSYAVREWGWLGENPVSKVKKPSEPRGRVRFLSDVERQTLLSTCKDDDNPYLYPIVVLALSTGGRWSELVSLKWRNIDLKRQMLTFEETKNGEIRSIPITGHGLELLKNISKVRRIDSPYVFARKDGKKPMEIRKRWEKAVKKAKNTLAKKGIEDGLNDFRFHDLRHTCASYLAMQGASLMEISAVLGHKTLAMVKRYSHLSEQHTRGVLERMNNQQFAFEEVENV